MTSVDVLREVWALAGVAALLAWVASLMSGDTSWVDRAWSILPAIYVVVFAAHERFAVARLDVITVLVLLWAIRLTFNFARKGGYSGVEDYRWRALRATMSSRQFQVFNFTFIALYQNALLVLLTLPVYDITRANYSPWGADDTALSVLFLGALVGETIADQQQWDFQREKRRALARRDSPEPGFLRAGLFRYSRHPNYFFEIAQWWIVFAFAVVTTHHVLRWSALGPVLLTLLFVGSTRFTESLSAAKYPQYEEYQRDVSAIVPWWPRTPRARSPVTPDAT